MTVKSRNYLLIALAIFFFTAITLLICSRKKVERSDPETISKTIADGSSIEFMKVKLFYCSESSAFLQPVYREIEVPETKEGLYKKYIDLLLAGSSGLITPVPDGTQLRSIFFLQKMEMLVLDFNDSLINAFPGGTAAELEFIYFFVDNICYNFKEIKKVKFLSGGNEYKTLAGHIALEKPFFPDYNRLKDE